VESAVAERRRHPRVAAGESAWRAVRLRTGDPLSLVNLGPDGALVESSRQLLPGTSVILQVSVDDGTLTLRAEVTRCAVHVLRSDAIRYRGGLLFQGREGPRR
jgi:hypothetical protein